MGCGGWVFGGVCFGAMKRGAGCRSCAENGPGAIRAGGRRPSGALRSFGPSSPHAEARGNHRCASGAGIRAASALGTWGTRGKILRTMEVVGAKMQSVLINQRLMHR